MSILLPAQGDLSATVVAPSGARSDFRHNPGDVTTLLICRRYNEVRRYEMKCIENARNRHRRKLTFWAMATLSHFAVSWNSWLLLHNTEHSRVGWRRGSVVRTSVLPWSMVDMWPLHEKCVHHGSTNYANSAFHRSGLANE